MVSNTEARKKWTDLTEALKIIHVNLGQMLTKCNKEIGEYNTCHNRRLLCTTTSKSTVISQKPILFTHNLLHQEYTSCGSYHKGVILMEKKYLSHTIQSLFRVIDDRLMHFVPFAQRKRKTKMLTIFLKNSWKGTTLTTWRFSLS